MADTTFDIKTDEHGTKYFVNAENETIYFRACFATKVHDPHYHKSYYFAANVKNPNAWCVGEGVGPNSSAPNPYRKDWGSSTWKSKPAYKNYADDAENFPVSNPITVEEARTIAYDMHSKQKDKAGEEYWIHLEAVEKGVQVLGGSDEERIAALFHDAVEDWHTTYTLLKGINVTDNTLVMIEAVSKKTGEQQTSYLERIKKAGNTLPVVLTDLGITSESIDQKKTSEGAKRVKIADLLHNTRHDRIQALRDDKKAHTADRLLKKYRPALAALMMDLGMIISEDEQKKIATTPQGTASTYTTSTYTAPKKRGPACKTHKRQECYVEACKPEWTHKCEDHKNWNCWKSPCKFTAIKGIDTTPKTDLSKPKAEETVVKSEVPVEDLWEGDTIIGEKTPIKTIELKTGSDAAALGYSVIVMEDGTRRVEPHRLKDGTKFLIEIANMTTPMVMAEETEEDLPMPKGWKVGEILPGDWVREWDAPVIDTKDIEGSSPQYTEFLLANGEEKTVPHFDKGTSVFLYAYSADVWRNESRLFEDVPLEVWNDYYGKLSSAVMAEDPDAWVSGYAEEEGFDYQGYAGI